THSLIVVLGAMVVLASIRVSACETRAWEGMESGEAIFWGCARGEGGVRSARLRDVVRREGVVSMRRTSFVGLLVVGACMVARRGGIRSGEVGWSGAGVGEEWTREARVVVGFEVAGWDMERCVVDREMTS